MKVDVDGGGHKWMVHRQDPCRWRLADDVVTSFLLLLSYNTQTISMSHNHFHTQYNNLLFQLSNKEIQRWRKIIRSFTPMSKSPPPLGITLTSIPPNSQNTLRIIMHGDQLLKKRQTIWSPLSRHNFMCGLQKLLVQREVCQVQALWFWVSRNGSWTLLFECCLEEVRYILSSWPFVHEVSCFGQVIMAVNIPSFFGSKVGWRHLFTLPLPRHLLLDWYSAD